MAGAAASCAVAPVTAQWTMPETSSKEHMMKIHHTGMLGVASLLLLAACASAPEQTAEYHAPKVYRTGSNIPLKDHGASTLNLEIESPEVMNPMNRPIARQRGPAAGGGG